MEITTQKIKKTEMQPLIQSIIEVQQNAGRMIAGQFQKGIHFKMDYDLSRLSKKLTEQAIQYTNEWLTYMKERGLKYENNQTIFPESYDLKMQEEFRALDEKTWSEEVEFEVKKFDAKELEEIIFQNCQHKNLFFIYLVGE